MRLISIFLNFAFIKECDSMSLTKRLAVIAIFINIMLLFFCPGIALVGKYTGLRALLSVLMAFAPLVAFVFLIVGCVPAKETGYSRAVCRVGLFIMAFSIASMAYCWDFGHNGVYPLFDDLQTADVQRVGIYVGTVTNQNITMVELDEIERTEVLALMQQVTCRNPHASVKQTSAQDSGCFNFFVNGAEGDNFCFGVYPPYYVDSHEIAYRAEDEQVCQQLADLYADLRLKYEPMALIAAE